MEQFANSSTQTSLEQTLTDGETTVMVGSTNRLIFFSVFFVALLLVAGMASMVTTGAVAMAASLPVPFTIQATTLKGTNFHLYPGISKADNATPVGISQMDCTITNLVITKAVQLPVVGTVTLSLKSQGATPANLTGLTTNLTSLGANQAEFQNIAFNTGSANGLDINAATTTLDGVNISSPYLLTNSITLPGLTFSIGK